MICVIQCAASKQPTAGHMLAHDGSLVDFVADPRAAPPMPLEHTRGPMTLPKTENHGANT